jgi:hypothetical protein
MRKAAQRLGRSPLPILLLLSAALFSGLAAGPASGQIFLEDDFPGDAEDPNWDYSWNVGIGSTTFDATSPGFAHLNLAGPWSAPPAAYQNAEIIRHSVPAYHNFEVRLRNSNNNGWDAPGAPDTPDPAYGLGSRGWGLWNSNINSIQEAIWFTSISPESSPAFAGTRVVVVHQGLAVVWQDLGIDLTEWHTYHIQWREDYIGVFVDDMVTPIAEVTNPESIPSEALDFTTWIDNYVVTGDLIDPTFGYLDVPAMDQYIDVDYVKIYVSACSNGVDDDGDGLADYPADPGCDDLDDLAERSPLLVCDDGSDNDTDGLIDYPNDPGCAHPASDIENPQCQDGVNNDLGQDPNPGLIDFDGGQSIWGACTGLPGGCPANVSDPEGDGVANPDPQCVGKPWRNQERKHTRPCGLGAELALLLPPLIWLSARRRLSA